PLGFVDGMNLYRAYFVPNGVDPSGRKAVGNLCLRFDMGRKYEKWKGIALGALNVQGGPPLPSPTPITANYATVLKIRCAASRKIYAKYRCNSCCKAKTNPLALESSQISTETFDI